MLFILLTFASEETKEENKSQFKNWDATALFFYALSCSIVHSENTRNIRRKGLLSFVLSTTYWFSRQWCTVWDSSLSRTYLFTGKGDDVRSNPNYEPFHRKLFTAREGCTVTPCTVICHCWKGLSWRAIKQKVVSLNYIFKKKRPCEDASATHISII